MHTHVQGVLILVSSHLNVQYAMNQFKNGANLSKYSIKAIAKEVGFGTPESFSNAFEKEFGIKPSVFIKKLHEG